MKKVIVLLLFLANALFADALDSLLQEYQSTTEKSLKTVNEKLGHVVIYSQQELRMMQYTKLDDILKELPLMSLGKKPIWLLFSFAYRKQSRERFFSVFYQ